MSKIICDALSVLFLRILCIWIRTLCSWFNLLSLLKLSLVLLNFFITLVFRILICAIIKQSHFISMRIAHVLLFSRLLLNLLLWSSGLRCMDGLTHFKVISYMFYWHLRPALSYPSFPRIHLLFSHVIQALFIRYQHRTPFFGSIWNSSVGRGHRRVVWRTRNKLQSTCPSQGQNNKMPVSSVEPATL